MNRKSYNIYLIHVLLASLLILVLNVSELSKYLLVNNLLVLIVSSLLLGAISFFLERKVKNYKDPISYTKDWGRKNSLIGLGIIAASFILIVNTEYIFIGYLTLMGIVGLLVSLPFAFFAKK